MTDRQDNALEAHLLGCATEGLAQVNGAGEWKIGRDVYYIADEFSVEVDAGTVWMVRKADGQWFEINLSVVAWPVDKPADIDTSEPAHPAAAGVAGVDDDAGAEGVGAGLPGED